MLASVVFPSCSLFTATSGAVTVGCAVPVVSFDCVGFSLNGLGVTIGTGALATAGPLVVPFGLPDAFPGATFMLF